MDINSKLNDDPNVVNNKIEYDQKMKLIKEEISKKLIEYRKTMDYLVTDAPIQILGLPVVIENLLLDNGCLRVYHLLDVDFTKIKGLGETRIRQLTSCLDKFFSML
jgi:hypothetical protein